MRRLDAAILAAGACLAVALPAQAAAPTVRVAQSLDVSSGRYGTTVQTDVLAATTTVRVTQDAWFARASLPLLEVIEHEDGQGTDPSWSRTQSGLGDLSVTAGRTFDRIGGSHVRVDVMGRVKLPTGNASRGLGGGGADLTLLTETSYETALGGVYVDIGRRLVGGADDSWRRDHWRGGVGGWWTASPRLELGGGLDWRQATYAEDPDPVEAFAYVSYFLRPSLRLDVNASAGLNRNSPDYGFGVTLAWRPETGRRP